LEGLLKTWLETGKVDESAEETNTEVVTEAASKVAESKPVSDVKDAFDSLFNEDLPF